ncbi:MAG: zinc ABC transporter substrate-binding protein [Eubacteriales bacterium]|nr:zinc ABC transporter substrate-binding protein [Eubacteriales bacterium]
MKIPKILLLSVCLAFTILIFFGCAKTANDSGKRVIAVTIVPEMTMVREVAGDLFDIITLIPPGNSPEHYQPSPQLIEKLSRADIYFTIGVPAESANILPRIMDLNPDILIVNLFETVARTYPPIYFDEAHEDDNDSSLSGSSKEAPDPHIWLSPKRVALMTEIIAEKLSEIDSSNKEYYYENAQAYKSVLGALDAEIRSSFEGIGSRTFFIYHPSLGYFADDYGLEMLSLEESGKEATAATIQRMADIAEEKNIKVIFYQASSDSKQAIAFAEEIDGSAVMIDPLAAEYEENMREIAATFKEVLNRLPEGD